jgi:hypothetical protein
MQGTGIREQGSEFRAAVTLRVIVGHSWSNLLDNQLIATID